MKSPGHLMLFTMLITLVGTLPLHAQWDMWSNPISITDSVTDNTNPVLQHLSFIENDYYVFWEKSSDSSSTAIYYKNFYNGSEPDIFLSEEGVHYTNPQLMETKYGWGDDTLFSVFYLSDESGKNQVYYRVYNRPEGFTAPQVLFSSDVEQTELKCSQEGRLVWMEQNQIMTSLLDKTTFTFSEPLVIDSGNCTSPSIVGSDGWFKTGYSRPEIAWIKQENDSASIWIKRYNQPDGWMESEKHFTARQCANLSFCNGLGPLYILTWDYFNDTSWRMIHYDIEQNDLYVSEFDQMQAFQPAFFSGFIPVKSRYIEAGFTSIVALVNDTVNIYNSDFFFDPIPGLDYYQNVSNSYNIIRKPKLFFGKYESPCQTYINNIWEEKVNGHWQLKYAETWVCLSGIEEEVDEITLDLKAYPNPFSDEIKLSFQLDKKADVLLTISNSTGTVVQILEAKEIPSGKHQYKWNGKMHKAGLYFVSLQKNSERVTQKIVLTK